MHLQPFPIPRLQPFGARRPRAWTGQTERRCFRKLMPIAAPVDAPIGLERQGLAHETEVDPAVGSETHDSLTALPARAEQCGAGNEVNRQFRPAKVVQRRPVRVVGHARELGCRQRQRDDLDILSRQDGRIERQFVDNGRQPDPDRFLARPITQQAGCGLDPVYRRGPQKSTREVSQRRREFHPEQAAGFTGDDRGFALSMKTAWPIRSVPGTVRSCPTGAE